MAGTISSVRSGLGAFLLCAGSNVTNKLCWDIKYKFWSLGYESSFLLLLAFSPIHV